MGFRDTFTAHVPQDIIEDPAFKAWEEDLDGSLVIRVEAARAKIQCEGIITEAKNLGAGLFEKKWNSGLRLYFSVVINSGRKTLLLLGSGKGDQNKAIRSARGSLKKYSVVPESIEKQD